MQGHPTAWRGVGQDATAVPVPREGHGKSSPTVWSPDKSFGLFEASGSEVFTLSTVRTSAFDFLSTSSSPLAMKFLLVLAAVLALSSTARAQFGSVSATSDLTGEANIPPSRTKSTGTFSVVLNDLVGSFRLSVSNIVNLTQVHLHNGDKRTNDGDKILVLIPTLPFPISITGTVRTQGTFNSTELVGPLAGKQLVDLANLINKGDVYINAHTGSGDGTTFIRGQVAVESIGTATAAVAAPPPAADVPTRRLF